MRSTRPWQLSQPIPLADVDAVIEVHVIGQIVDAGPHDGIAGAETFAHGLERGTGGPDLRMAVHAGLGGRDAGERRGLDRSVAVPAVDADAADVMRVAERHRLLARHVLARVVTAAIQLAKAHARKPSTKTAPKMLSRESVLVL